MDLILKQIKTQFETDLILNNMVSNKIKKYSIYSIIGFIVILLINLLQLLPNETSIFIRKFKVIIGYFVFIPLLIITSYFSFIIFWEYVKNKFLIPIKYFLLIIPFLIYIVYSLLILVYGVFIKTY